MSEQTEEFASQPVWLIVGAAGGLGGAIAREALGMPDVPALVLLDKNRRGLEKLADELEGLAGSAISIYPLDLSGATPTDYDAMLEAILAAHGRLDVVIFCQAQCAGLQPMLQTHGRDWLLELHANLGGPQLLLQASLSALLESPSGRVVFCVNGEDSVSGAYWGAYGVAQNGLRSLARQWSEEMANTSLRFLLCYPGAMRTALRMGIWPAVKPDNWPEPSVCAGQLAEWLQTDDLPAELQTLKIAG